MLLAYEFKLVFFVGVSVVALVSVIGNVLAITSFLKRKVLRTSTNYYITSMAVSDLLFVVTDGALYASSSLSSFVISLTSFGCKLGRYCTYVSYSVSVLSLVLITVDRFIATVFPMKVTMITRRARMFFILLTWLVPTGILVPLLYSAKVSEESDGPYRPWNQYERLDKLNLQHTGCCAVLLCTFYDNHYPQFSYHEIFEKSKSCDRRKWPKQCKTETESTNNEALNFDRRFVFHLLDSNLRQ